MNLFKTYKGGEEGQIAQIKRFSSLAIITIWAGGCCSVIVYILFFLVSNAQKNGSAFNPVNGINHLSQTTAFGDKTTLVNIGLRMQEISGVANVQSTGSMRIHKINYDQQIHKTLSPLPKPGFFIKAVPK